MNVADRLERAQWDLSWVPEDTIVHDRPELLYTSCPRDLTYLNMVTRVDPAHPRLDALVAEVERTHASVRSRWSVPSRIATDDLHLALERGGYEATCEHDARAVEVRAFSPRPAPACEVIRVSTLDHMRDLVAVTNAGFGDARMPSEKQLHAELQACIDPRGRVHRFVAYAHGRPVASGGLSAHGDLEFGFLWAGCTIPGARGCGFYSALVAERIAWARQHGLSWVGLYARTTTSSPIVERQGFERVGAMTYWERTPQQ
jgi:GNAT superfamily N-acetyltransferase